MSCYPKGFIPHALKYYANKCMNITVLWMQNTGKVHINMPFQVIHLFQTVNWVGNLRLRAKHGPQASVPGPLNCGTDSDVFSQCVIFVEGK